jgi:uncharacterized membrane protein YcaP (DUF421 family)
VGLGPIAFRAAFAYVFLLAMIRASGKRTVAQGTTFDFVLALVLGDMIDDLVWGEVGAARFAVAVGVLCGVHLVVALLVAASTRVHDVVQGQPSRVLEDGRPVPAGLRKERMNRGELEEMLRHHGILPDRWHEVAYAQIEDGGSLTCVLHERFREAQRRDLSAAGGQR